MVWTWLSSLDCFGRKLWIFFERNNLGTDAHSLQTKRNLKVSSEFKVVMRCRQIDGGGISDCFERFFHFLIWKLMSHEKLIGIGWKNNLLANDRNNNDGIWSSNKNVIGFEKDYHKSHVSSLTTITVDLHGMRGTSQNSVLEMPLQGHYGGALKIFFLHRILSRSPTLWENVISRKDHVIS